MRNKEVSVKNVFKKNRILLRKRKKQKGKYFFIDRTGKKDADGDDGGDDDGGDDDDGSEDEENTGCLFYEWLFG